MNATGYFAMLSRLDPLLVAAHCITMTTLYGIATCETVRKSRKWLGEHGIPYRYHDLRLDGLTREQAALWLEKCGLAEIVNRRSTTWKNLSPELRAGLDEDNAADLLVSHPTLVKRPVLEINGTIRTGFNPSTYSQIFSK